MRAGQGEGGSTKVAANMTVWSGPADKGPRDGTAVSKRDDKLKRTMKQHWGGAEQAEEVERKRWRSSRSSTRAEDPLRNQGGGLLQQEGKGFRGLRDSCRRWKQSATYIQHQGHCGQWYQLINQYNLLWYQENWCSIFLRLPYAAIQPCLRD